MKNIIKDQKRQGDVLVDPNNVDSPTTREVPKDGGKTVLAYGEVTGHSHSLPGTNVKLFRMDDTALTSYLKVDTEVLLKHEEHREAPIRARNYRVIQQRQYTLERQIRRVAD